MPLHELRHFALAQACQRERFALAALSPINLLSAGERLTSVSRYVPTARMRASPNSRATNRSISSEGWSASWRSFVQHQHQRL
jgi:hypothetical protein